MQGPKCSGMDAMIVMQALKRSFLYAVDYMLWLTCSRLDKAALMKADGWGRLDESI